LATEDPATPVKQPVDLEPGTMTAKIESNLLDISRNEASNAAAKQFMDEPTLQPNGYFIFEDLMGNISESDYSKYFDDNTFVLPTWSPAIFKPVDFEERRLSNDEKEFFRNLSLDSECMEDYLGMMRAENSYFRDEINHLQLLINEMREEGFEGDSDIFETESEYDSFLVQAEREMGHCICMFSRNIEAINYIDEIEEQRRRNPEMYIMELEEAIEYTRPILEQSKRELEMRRYSLTPEDSFWISIYESEIADYENLINGWKRKIKDLRKQQEQSLAKVFIDKTSFKYDLEEQSPVKLEIYNTAGRLVKTLVNEKNVAPGEYSVTWDGTGSDGNPVPNGIYFYKCKIGDESSTRKLVLVR
jgi:hypothetical protein